ncbi:MAG: hypothetical protein AAF466_04750 [Bacteroidota bacterium]
MSETRHTFTDGGRKFDKVLNQIDEVLKEFIYQGDNLTEIIVQEDEGTDHYFYTYSGNDITNVTVEETRNDVTETRNTDYIHDNNTITVVTPDDPPNLFRQRFAFNASGKVTQVESYLQTGSDSYEYFDLDYEYNDAGLVSRYELRGATYRPSDGQYLYDVRRWTVGGWDYFDDVVSPFKNLAASAYQVMLLTPEVFYDGIFENGSLGLLEDKFVTHFSIVNVDLNAFVQYQLIRPKNIVKQTNGLPRSGHVMFGFRPFEFTYAE